MTDVAAAANSLGDVARLQAKARPDVAAFVFEARTTTFSQFDSHTNRTANALIAVGVKPGARVSYVGK